MSVLIKDMGKPKSCYAVIDGESEYCPFVNTDDDCVLLLKKGTCEGTWAEQYSKCPLIEVSELCEDAVSRQAAIDGADAIIARDISGNNDVVKAMTAWKSYVEALPSAQPDRDIPVKPIGITDSAWGIPSRQAVCPKCDYYLTKVYFIPNDTADTTHSRKVSYCGNCGQAIDWSKWEDEE